jgi:hypothetical protein
LRLAPTYSYWYQEAIQTPARTVLSNLYQPHTWFLLLQNMCDQYLIGVYTWYSYMLGRATCAGACNAPKYVQIRRQLQVSLVSQWIRHSLLFESSHGFAFVAPFEAVPRLRCEKCKSFTYITWQCQYGLLTTQYPHQKDRICSFAEAMCPNLAAKLIDLCERKC